MSRWVSWIRLAGSILFAGFVASRLSIPETFPLRDWCIGLVVVATVGGPWPDWTFVSLFRGKVRGSRRIRMVGVLAIDCLAIGLILAFLNVPGTAFDLLSKIAVAGIVAGAIPGWPDAARQIARLLGFKLSASEPASL